MALFIYVSTHCVEIVKQLDYNRYSQLTRWCRGNVMLWVREVPGSIPCSGKGFDFWFGGFCVFTFCKKTHDLLQNFAIPCAMLIYLVYLTYCKICDRLQGYKDTDLASLMLCILRSEVLFVALCICTVLIFKSFIICFINISGKM